MAQQDNWHALRIVMTVAEGGTRRTIAAQVGAKASQLLAIVGNLTNDGTLLLGDLTTEPGTLSEIGDYIQNSDGTFFEGIGSGGSGMFDVTGDINLGGMLDIGLLGGFNPANDEVFNLIQFNGAETGYFSGIEGSDAAGWTVLYGAKVSDLIQLEYIDPNATPPCVPEPSVWLDQVFLLSLALVYPFIRRRLAPGHCHPTE